MGVRELILLGVVGAISVIALARPRVGLYGYLWFALSRPDLLAFVEDKYQISLILAVATAIGATRYWHRIGVVFTNPYSKGLLLLQVPIGLSVLFSLEPRLAFDRYSFYTRMILVLLLIPILMETEAHLRTLLLVIAISLGIVGLRLGLYGVIHGGVELAGGYGDMLGDNNFVALAMAMLIPLCWYCRSLTPYIWTRLLLLGIACASIPAVIMTNSRGGSLAMGLGLLLIFSRTRRKLASVILVGMVLGGAVYLVRDQYLARMSTLENYEQEASARSRIEHAHVAFEMWKDHPLLGVGFGGMNYAALVSQYTGEENIHVAHNSYLQMLVDSGIFAFLIYAWLLMSSILWLHRSARQKNGSNAAISLAIGTPMAVSVLGGYFYSWQRIDLPYILLMCCAAWYNLTHGESLSTEKQLLHVERKA